MKNQKPGSDGSKDKLHKTDQEKPKTRVQEDKKAQPNSSTPSTVSKPKKAENTVTTNPEVASAAQGLSGSQPNHIPFDELMKAADTFSSLSLAHEISIDSNFRLEKQDLPENSLEKKVRETMLQAFWDILREELNAKPPVYKQAIALLQEIKETLALFLTPRNIRLKQNIDEHLDMELIRQELEHGAFDLKAYASYVIDTMGKMCAPVRDEEVAKLKSISDPVVLYSEIFRVLDLMKMDMANFTIAQMRPYIKQNAVEYERKKFQEYLQAQKTAGLDELELTRHWLKTACSNLKEKGTKTSQIHQATSSSSKATSSNKVQNPEQIKSKTSNPEFIGASESDVTPYNILIEASMQLFDWPDSKPYPETLQMDENRMRTLREAVHHIILTATLILITGNVMQKQQNCVLTSEGTTQLRNKLKEHMIALMRNVLTCHFSQHDQALSLQITKDVNEALENEHLKHLDASSEASLKQQVHDVVNGKNPVAELLKSRLYQFLRANVFSPNAQPSQAVPNGFSLLQADINEICGHLLRLFAYNRTVFGPFYAEILEPLVNPTGEATSTKAPQ